ncbi:MAG: Bax inhibitor-1 family protein [Polyangiaceae bacterium]|nr:Bax inhibitor-1 family protein [Polyangiaceae bacterium]
MAQSYGYAGVSRPAARATVDDRARFIVRTYNHLFGAILLFTAIEFALFQLGLALPVAQALLAGGPLVMMGGFILVSWLASRVAFSAQSKLAQYAALTGFVFAEAVIFLPILLMANSVAPGAIQSAGIVTILGFAGLSAVVFTTRKDFSFLGGMLRWGGLLALVLIIAGAIFGFQLGTFFSVAMIGFAGAAILYDTSNVLHHFPTDRHVSAALQLFASVAMLFFYVLRLILSMSRR